jgi:N-acyl-D-aspartate/D-glutamate deacylase
MNRVMDIGAQVPHAALRFYVMGERGADHSAVPTADEITEMGRLLEESLHAGALGFTTSRTVKHKAADGRATPTLSAAEPELAGLGLELMLQQDGKALLIQPFENYTDGNLDNVRTMLSHPNCIAGLADAGAHVGVIADHSSATTMLTLWGRDRKRGEKLALEFLVRKQTMDTAHAYEMHDRSVIAPDKRADINLIDFNALRVKASEVRYYLPAGGKRLVQMAEGYRHTFCAGVETLSNGEFTGALPGRLIRG